jgi:two-component system, NarL family, sensor kinase
MIMAIPFIYLRLWISIFCGLIFLVELLAPVEYIFGYLYIIPILLAACELTTKGTSTPKILSITSIVTNIGVFMTLLDFIVVEIVQNGVLFFKDLPVFIIVNRLNVVIVLLVTNWLIQASLKHLGEIYRQKVEISQYKLALSAQIRLDQIHEDFVHTLTHDLETPLIGAIQTIKYFQQEKFGVVNSTQSKILNVMSRSQQRSLQLVETLLDVYRNDAQGLRLQHQPINLRSIAREAINTVIVLGLERQVTVNLKYDVSTIPEPQLIGDPLQLSRVFSNLLTNAIYHSPRGRQIDVTIHDRDHQCIVCIFDRGKGVASADLPFLFDRFYQAKKQLKGSGLGLYLSRQIVEAHGGRIWAEAILPQGAKFYFSLPLVI